MPMTRSQQTRLVIAVVLLIIAAGLVAWQAGWLRGGSPPANLRTATPEQVRASEEIESRTAADIEAGLATRGEP
jgi:hypothetical protein